MIDTIYTITSDHLRLPGIHYFPKDRTSLCVLVVHGMSGNILENYNFDILGKVLSQNGIACIYGHNRSYGHINDIRIMNKPKPNGGFDTIRLGAAYERFTDSLFDIQAWLDTTRQLGYQNIILLGHSLGCNKVIHFLSKNQPSDLIGLILASPPDMVGLVKKPEYQPDYDQLLSEARKNISKNNPRQLLSGLIWNWQMISSQTFLDLFIDHCPADNLPVLRNPDKFDEFSSIQLPILALVGEHDDIAIRSLSEDLDLIATKATSCKSFTKKFIPGANHSYESREKEFSETILNWIQNTL